jgi:hypothetical protein
MFKKKNGSLLSFLLFMSQILVSSFDLDWNNVLYVLVLKVWEGLTLFFF